MVQVNYYLKHNPKMFAHEEIQELERYRQMKRLAYVDMTFYFLLLFAGRNPVQTAGYSRNAFSSARQRFVFPRMLFLNIGMATHLVSTYRESKLRNYLAEKYFGHVQYA